jgi:hypothetical protein
MITTNEIRQTLTKPIDKLASVSQADDRPADRTLSTGEPSAPLLGVLPLRRLIPQDVHSMLHYANGAMTGAGALMTDDPAARMASIVLGASTVGVSAISDYRLSLAKIIPIEKHEAIDHMWGIAAIAAPFVLGYWKRAPRVAMMHVMAGASTILSSLVTDYRSAKRKR